MWRKNYILAIAGTLALASCAIVEPKSVALELEHVSHASQHRPFTDDPTAYGFDGISLAAKWQYKRAYVELSEGAILERCTPEWCGSLMGPREVFTGRVGVYLWQRR